MSEEMILVIDFGAQYGQLIARRIREARVYCEILPPHTPVEEILSLRPRGIVFSGGPASVYGVGAPRVDRRIFESGTPILGICYGMQLMSLELGGEVRAAPQREYGKTEMKINEPELLFQGIEAVTQVWMSHGDFVAQAPPGFQVLAWTENTPVAAMADVHRRLYGVQFHPEVIHTRQGTQILRNFLYRVCGLAGTWTPESIVEKSIREIREKVERDRVISALSGGLDSSVAAVLAHRAVGDQLTAIFVDHGLLRQGEAEQVVRTFREGFRMRLIRVDARERFLRRLAGVTEPEQKRKIIGEEFIRVFEEEAEKLGQIDRGVDWKRSAAPQPAEDFYPRGKDKLPKEATMIDNQSIAKPPFDETDAEASEASGSRAGAPTGKVRFLLQGTLYPDVIESGTATAATIKSHHNVGGLPEKMGLTLLEPLRELFKDEVRRVGEELGLPEEILWRQPFPGPGLAIRIIGEVTEERLEILREADAIVTEEIRKAGLYRQLWQSFAVLPTMRSVGVMGDERTYAYTVIIRAVTSEDGMTADWARLPYDLLERIASRIVNEVKHINRVAYDITSKPPATIEWE